MWPSAHFVFLFFPQPTPIIPTRLFPAGPTDPHYRRRTCPFLLRGCRRTPWFPIFGRVTMATSCKDCWSPRAETRVAASPPAALHWHPSFPIQRLRIWKQKCAARRLTRNFDCHTRKFRQNPKCLVILLAVILSKQNLNRPRVKTNLSPKVSFSSGIGRQMERA